MLNHLGRLAGENVAAALAVVAQLAEADATGQAPNPEVVRNLADEANDRAQGIRRALVRAGVSVPDLPPPSPVPLHLLSTPAGRRLLEALRAAVEAAEAVDAERGNVLPADFPLQEGETRGTGYAESLSEILLRLRVEVEGPKGRE
jgi:hypothetical protein